jgi:hypothetical protein
MPGAEPVAARRALRGPVKLTAPARVVDERCSAERNSSSCCSAKHAAFSPATFHWGHLREVLLGEISTNRSISPCLLNSLITKSTYPDIDNGERAAITWCEQPTRAGSIVRLAVGKDRLCIAVFILPQRQRNNSVAEGAER